MITRDYIADIYFDWLCDLVDSSRFSSKTSYKKLLTRLHQTEFIYLLEMDENRASDGLDLRYRFIDLMGFDIPVEEIYDKPCSVLEMLVALSLRCEETIMDDTRYGNRTGQWFWGMIKNLGLSDMIDSRFDRRECDYILKRFLNRDYDSDGRGGLFTIKDPRRDLRTVEIWYQLNWYLDTLLGG